MFMLYHACTIKSTKHTDLSTNATAVAIIHLSNREKNLGKRKYVI